MCGDRVYRYFAFIADPVAAVNRVAAEPACHRDCADFVVRDLPSLLERWDKVTLVWCTENFSIQWLEHEPRFSLKNAPVYWSWWLNKRAATFNQINAAIPWASLDALGALADEVKENVRPYLPRG